MQLAASRNGYDLTYTSIVAEGGASLCEVWTLKEKSLMCGKNGFVSTAANNQGNDRTGEVTDEAGARFHITALSIRQFAASGVVATLFSFGHLNISNGGGGCRGLLLGRDVLGELGGHGAGFGFGKRVRWI